jgi:hypothetical protein
MITQLQKVINELGRLSKTEQNAIAALIEEELSWDTTLKSPSPKLSKLAKEALKEHQENKTKKGDW